MAYPPSCKDHPNTPPRLSKYKDEHGNQYNYCPEVKDDGKQCRRRLSLRTSVPNSFPNSEVVPPQPQRSPKAPLTDDVYITPYNCAVRALTFAATARAGTIGPDASNDAIMKLAHEAFQFLMTHAHLEDRALKVTV